MNEQKISHILNSETTIRIQSGFMRLKGFHINAGFDTAGQQTYKAANAPSINRSSRSPLHPEPLFFLG